MSLVEQIHSRFVHGRRARVLARHLASLLPDSAAVLDVGCGDGLIDRLILDQRPDVEIRGIDILPRRGHTYIPVRLFDGTTIPHEAGAFDVVMLVDVLHHTTRILELLREARRVTRRHLLIKDHTATGLLARPVLRFMDAVGNARFGVGLPYNYWTRPQWDDAFRTLGLSVATWQADLKLYPVWANWLFGRSLHFIALLMGSAPGRQAP